jgi:hypothetical protein
MNKRIKELYAKANAWALHNYPPPVNPFEWEDLRSKKFAELIVRECADYVQFYYKDHMCEVIAHDMKTHFGVEE